MAIVCPNCDHRLNLKSPKPGRYRPRCPSCAKPFALVVPSGEGEPLRVQAIPNDTRNANPDHEKPHPSRKAPVPEPVPAGGPASGSHLFGQAKTNPDPRKARPAADPDGEPGSPSSVRIGNELEFAPPRADVRGYKIERELGRGGMGAVYLARQLSLDRLVALKVMGKRWANDPVFVARFTREAYAAAQLSHPNIVQIHDIGEVDGGRFFSMEFVPGLSLADMVRKHGKLDPETAVGYVLQSARGLKHAHDRGMIHRDVKPDNLLIDDSGLVKVADLGLVKTPVMSATDDTLAGGPRSGLNTIPADMTGARIALGTPAYMSPEQCRDAATVDHRADIYSLGCTLYVLVTGRPPFEGTTAVELMTKQAYEPIVPPEQIVSRVPKELSAVIQRMMAKHADDRFANMGEVIRTLESWLGVHHSGTFSPQEDEIEKLEAFTHQFHTASAAVLRGRVLKGAFALVLLIGVLVLFFGKAAWAVGLLGLVVQGTLAYLVIDGVARKGHLFSRVRRFVFGLGWSDWSVGAAGLALFGLLLGMFGVFWFWVGFGLAGLGLAFAVRYGLDRRVENERRAPVEACEKLLRRLRMRGLDEEDLRQFVAKFAGRNWEGFFEALFGFEAKMAARTVLLRGGSAGTRERHAAWREPLLYLIERTEKTRKEARERTMLQAVEQARLVASGFAQQEAASKATATAEAMVKEAEKIRKAESERARIGRGPNTGSAPATVGNLVRGSSNPDFVFEPGRANPLGRLVGLVVGSHVRAVLAAVLLAACGLWGHQNGLLPGAEVQAQATQAVQTKDLSGLEDAVPLDANRATKPLTVEGVPEVFTVWADSFNLGAAGLLLLLSLFRRGNAMAVFVLLGAAVAVVGHRFGIRTVEPLRDYHVALMLGSVLALVGFRMGTR